MRRTTRRIGAAWIAIAATVAAGSCGATRSTFDGAGGGAGGRAGIAGAAGAGGGASPVASAFCDGAAAFDATGPLPASPFVTYEDDSGQGCVLSLGEPVADVPTCGNNPSGLIEADCPSLSVFFDFRTARFAELSIQGAYAFTLNRQLRNGRVREIAIDSTEAAFTRGHFVIDLDPTETSPATRASGRFGMCMTNGLSIDPCRDM